MADRIPNNLIEILARLPVASLLRFKSICKPWYSLITSPSFVTEHLHQSITNTERNGSKLLGRVYDSNVNKERYLLVNDDDEFGDKYSELESPFEILFGYFGVVGSCNGLLWLVDSYLIDKLQIIIWNPSTRKSVTLPMAPKPQHRHTCVYGFGAHPATQEYKCQAFVDGAVHWVAYEPCVGGGVRNLIMLFNMASESFSEFKLPPTLACQPPPSLSIKTFGQSMAVLCSGPRDSGHCCIWVMKEYGVAESWTKLFSSNLLGRPNKTLEFRKNGKVLLVSDNCLASYAPGTNTLATTRIRGNSRSFYVDRFMDSFCLMTVMGSCTFCDALLPTSQEEMGDRVENTAVMKDVSES
ncbi:hypothetical protein RHMOL_Rhmol04G0091800 [Rhododendron molle]|uniref:Uncharacterized protein n=1 Tax=Rhododendron molle TaxID=49168 RepID=A0ACC0NZN6_RHOML|nr:hypothetical protein RHMOL_Rhmol04G0091800 [Rhododendron molle]